MSNRFWQKPRRITAGIVAGAIASMAALAASPAGAIVSTNYVPNNDGDGIVRLFGLDRYETSVEVANQYLEAAIYLRLRIRPLDGVIVASGDNFPDALTASALAGKEERPIILVPASGNLPVSVTNFLKDRNKVQANASVTVVGGTAAVADAVLTAIQATGTATPERLAGADRYLTGRAVAAAVGLAGEAKDVGAILGGTSVASASTLRTVIVATGENFPDALAAGPLAAGGFSAVATEAWHQIILTGKSALPAASISALLASQAKQAIILGGTNVIDAAVETQLKNAIGVGAKVTRIGGADRFATAAALNGTLASLGVLDASTSGTYAQPWDPTKVSSTGNVALANFANFPDALSAAPLLGLVRAALFGTASLPAATVTALNGVSAGKKQTLWVIGGPNAVDDATATGGLAAIDSTKIPAAAKPTLLSAAGSVKATAQASAKASSLVVTAKAGGAADGVAGNDWRLEFQDTNPATVSVSLDSTNLKVVINGDLDNSLTTGAPTAEAVAALLNGNAGISALFTASGTGTVPSTTGFIPLTGGTSQLTAKLTFSQNLTAVSSTLLTFQAVSGTTPVSAATAAIDSTTKTVVNAVWNLSGTNSLPRTNISEITAQPGAVTSANGTNTGNFVLLTIS